MKASFKNLLPLLICAAALSVTACAKKGPLERAGEKVDHVGDTIKNGGSEPMSGQASGWMRTRRAGTRSMTRLEISSACKYGHAAALRAVIQPMHWR